MFYVVRNSNGLLEAFTSKPVKSEDGVWYMENDSDSNCIVFESEFFNDLEYNNDPVKAELLPMFKI